MNSFEDRLTVSFKIKVVKILITCNFLSKLEGKELRFQERVSVRFLRLDTNTSQMVSENYSPDRSIFSKTIIHIKLQSPRARRSPKIFLGR